ncbi:apolipoprotein D-like [Chironomus tepperi]|uniref:apolipoprotein D-like n=1 Tax=Chironomus tepperi TaxID=113505 RepID=UPI00391FC5F8
MKYLIAVLFFATVANAEIFDRPCRTPQELGVKVDFRPVAYLGIWYEIERYEQFFQAGGDCVRAQYTLNADGSINVLNSAFVIENATRIEAEGTARISFPDEEPLRAQLNVTFDANQPNLSNYWVLSTDYSNYAFVVSCMDLQENRSLESFWLLSRSFELSPTIRARADELIARNLDASRIRPTIQDNVQCGREF